MAIPKKGSRLITVDGTVFRWRVRRKPTYCQGNSWGPMTFAVELAGASGRVLLVSLPCSRPDAWWGERTMAIRPALVTATIRTALNHERPTACLRPPFHAEIASSGGQHARPLFSRSNHPTRLIGRVVKGIRAVA
ncbi:hypothetical protein HD596_010220 [Nonomuraea jabiensis]|uniref:Uncharacterized protein n=1 Tax=Nonomuraea jabiensis TaxID=882448 RepID=A0A7W9LGZ8_9ACTN|nr:hypothetical protein [Nonomuraea jabiensis]